MSDVDARIVLAVAGVALAAGGIALAANFRGCATWHARRSLESVRWLERPLRHVPPWKQTLEQPVEDRVARQAGLTRFAGAVFACAGLLLFISAFAATNITTS